ncbi:MAG: S49 family peptidase, partial [Rhizobiaceae bacterium]|nr:S49 family peptidase [Rhizobiaceae bacterium]
LERCTGIGVRDRVAIVYINGTLFHHESFLTRRHGLPTYDTLEARFRRAINHDKIDAVMLYVDSDGGEVSGVSDLAHTIYAARRTKPIGAYISGMGCSAAYWLASAASHVTVSDLAIVGSIGVVQAYENHSARDEKRGVRNLAFVSSQSPNKGFVPDRVQRMVDQMADVFVKAVAKHRGVSADTVMTKFGKGGVEVGANAVKAGMVDAVGSFDSAMTRLRKQPTPIIAAPLSAAKPAQPKPVRIAVPAAPIQLSAGEKARITAAAKAEAETLRRIRQICQSPEGKADPDRAAHFAFDTDKSAAEAIAAMKQERIAASWKAAAQQAAGFI